MTPPSRESLRQQIATNEATLKRMQVTGWWDIGETHQLEATVCRLKQELGEEPEPCPMRWASQHEDGC